MENELQEDKHGVIKIADDVVAIIAEIAAKEIKGVIGMSGGIADISDLYPLMAISSNIYYYTIIAIYT